MNETEKVIKNKLNICETEGCNTVTSLTDNGTRFYSHCDKCRIKYYERLRKEILRKYRNTDNIADKQMHKKHRMFLKHKIEKIKEGM